MTIMIWLLIILQALSAGLMIFGLVIMYKLIQANELLIEAHELAIKGLELEVRSLVRCLKND